MGDVVGVLKTPLIWRQCIRAVARTMMVVAHALDDTDEATVFAYLGGQLLDHWKSAYHAFCEIYAIKKPHALDSVAISFADRLCPTLTSGAFLLHSPIGRRPQSSNCNDMASYLPIRAIMPA